MHVLPPAFLDQLPGIASHVSGSKLVHVTHASQRVRRPDDHGHRLCKQLPLFATAFYFSLYSLVFVNILYSTLRSFNLPLIVPNSLSD